MSAVSEILGEFSREERIKQYKTDPTIEMFRKIMFKINCLAKPRILINITDPTKSIFEIDEQSQAQIKYWEQKMEEYILITYSDIIVTDGKEIST
jgi:hypothetical protein